MIYVVRSWPRLSQTFILNEVLALERRGLPLQVFALVHSGEEIVQPEVADVQAPVAFLDDVRGQPRRKRLLTHLDVLRAAPVRYARTLLYALRKPGLARGYSESSVLGCFRSAVHVTAAILSMRRAGHQVRHVHGHFAHDPALVAMLTARLSGTTYSFTGHARDLVQIPTSSLTARAKDATVLVTCCQANAGYISSVVPSKLRPRVLVVHHGIEVDRFRPAQHAHETGANGRTPTILSVGRLVDKKGYDDLLMALALVKASGAAFRCRIYGDGPRRDDLIRRREILGLADRVEFLGTTSRERIIRALGDADVFALTPRVTEDGDRDGIPNVLVEAMACGLPVVTSAAGGIPELVQNQLNGIVVEPGDHSAIMTGLRTLLDDRMLARRLGASARRTVEREHNMHASARVLDREFRGSAWRESA